MQKASTEQLLAIVERRAHACVPRTRLFRVIIAASDSPPHGIVTASPA